jgi:hypothetical protein
MRESDFKKRSRRNASKKALILHNPFRITAPTPSEECVFINYKLGVVSKDKTLDAVEDNLVFDTTWTPEQLNAQLRRLFPGPFKYLDENHPVAAGSSNPFHWIALSKEKGGLVEYDGIVNGSDLSDLITPQAKGPLLQRLYFGATFISLSFSVY